MITFREWVGPGVVGVAMVVVLPLSGCGTSSGSAAAAAPSPASSVGIPASGSSGASTGVPGQAPPSAGAPATATSAASATPSPSRSSAPPARTAPDRFVTLPPGSTMPSGAQCAEWVRARPYPENKGVNSDANQTTGHPIVGSLFTGDDPRANARLATRVNGQFTGTTREILRWTACKWGIDEEIVFAQAATESWWTMTALGDWTGSGSRCAPGRPLGADGRPGECPESFGILQVRYPYARAGWPGTARSTAMNTDVAYAIWRTCFEGYSTWLDNTGRGGYVAGDAWGCVGRGGSGTWHSPEAADYISRVRSNLDRRIWLTPNFQEP